MVYLPLIQLFIFGLPVLTLVSNNSKRFKLYILGHFELTQTLIEFAIIRPLSESELKVLREWRPNKKFRYFIGNDPLKNYVSLIELKPSNEPPNELANITHLAEENELANITHLVREKDIGDFVKSLFEHQYYIEEPSLV
ncbi:5617_t:CDS:1 [Acaulospora morrowiae]|uniref:5617_t:CDS:1 n=1 Tax=Acaulospora morrowiae TaxID=94023 RepID=A0A9N9EAM9_9GLOM|nr:5617_t:CDS:1 [Acaulospora morrowiae]